MVTQADIEDGEKIDIRVQVLSKLSCTTDKMANRLKVCDTAGNEFPLALWKNNALSDFAWEEGRWYELTNAKGNEFKNKKSLNGSYQLDAEPIEAPTSDDQTNSPTLLDSLDDGVPYLSLFEFDRSFEELKVYQYSIEATAVFDDDPMNETYRLAGYLRACSGAGVSVVGAMSIITTDPMSVDLPDPFTLTDETRTTLYADDKSDNEQIVRLLQQLVKKTVDDDVYETGRVDRIHTKQPVIKGPDGLFEACLSYSVRLDLFPSGDGFAGIELSHHARSRVTVDEYIEQINATVDELVGTHVEHDPETYSKPGSGTLKGFADKRYTDPIPDFGGQSLADWYEQQGRISDELSEQLRSKNPQLIEIQYNPHNDNTDIHVPDLLRVSPKKEVVKKLAPEFHRKWDRAAKMLPDERFRKAIEFVDDLDPLSGIDSRITSTPVGPSLSFMSSTVDRSNNLRFRDNQTTSLPSTGLRKYGAHSRPSSFKIQYLVPECCADQFKQLRDRLEKQLRSWGCEPDETSYTEYELGSAVNYSNSVAMIDDVDAVLAVVPSPNDTRIRNGDIDDPYAEFKKALGKQAIPS
ncbi:hypothetical protein [Halohasta litchfieldiae]|jgi:hypothetical protein|uniref:Uncharacterized protein n=1 Tax=Halohasta litchfieldiae TaxID=1073996 RepID=A0A1H6VV02_9EURY|nr:hypothetical protein [Halohasta litchfieldiae]SEJ07516.1 hypothetical protein SAMN05444271_11954 [Halohasta litchfieldiae]